MSGGSHDYLCWKDADQLLWRIPDVEAMGQDLGDYPGSAKAVAATFEVAAKLSEIQEAIAEADVMCRELEEVWRAVEWHHSGDSTAAAVAKAIRALEEGS